MLGTAGSGTAVKMSPRTRVVHFLLQPLLSLPVPSDDKEQGPKKNEGQERTYRDTYDTALVGCKGTTSVWDLRIENPHHANGGRCRQGMSMSHCHPNVTDSERGRGLAPVRIG
jgi:hypothetical protein